MTPNEYPHHDRLIDSKELKKLVSYSRSHILRLEAKGMFPLRIHITPSKVVWSYSEVMAWIEAAKLTRSQVLPPVMEGAAQ